MGNSSDSIAPLVEAWRGRNLLVVFEATGVYDQTLARALHDAGIRYTRVNPQRARDFARACGRIAKTDALDARMLATYGRALELEETVPPSASRQRLRDVATRRDQLVAIRAQEKTRASESDGWTAEHIGHHIDFLSDEIVALDKEIQRTVKADDALRKAAPLLRSAPGIGPVAACFLLATLPELGRLSPKALGALAGLAPMNVDSGQFRGKRMIKGGRKRVRDALYMAALGAIRCKKDSLFKTLYERLRSKGKPAKLALIAVARKLLTTLNAMVRDEKDTRRPYLIPRCGEFDSPHLGIRGSSIA
ncbi:IS110 family transposase [Rhodospirillum sp. A1_3_36]|uniref:IS110 family transposase n=1 Tax=Rhodospirillum sp. A1_3_36 TaxID=3391666 RepID=UPI0039A5CE99